MKKKIITFVGIMFLSFISYCFSTNKDYEKTKTILLNYEIENESKLTLEDWMLNDEKFLINKNENIEYEKPLTIENWMLDYNHFN